MRACVEHILRGMKRTFHRCEFDDARSAFERVECAERGIKRVSIVRSSLEDHQTRACLFDLIARLEDELFDELAHRGIPHIIEANSTSRPRSMGFTR